MNQWATLIDAILATGILRGTLASRPAAGWAGRLFIATDAGNEAIYFDTGSVWQTILLDGNLVFTAEGLTVQGHLLFGGGTAPTAAAGANNGGTPPAPVVAAGANDTRGSITFGTGTAATAGAQVVVTFAATYTTAPFVFIVPKNGQTANLNPFIGAQTATGFTYSLAGTPASGTGNTNYAFDYFCLR